jgi:hypothetical protein
MLLDVDDPDRLIAFYCDLLGLAFAFQAAGYGGLAIQETGLRLYERPRPLDVADRIRDERRSAGFCLTATGPSGIDVTSAPSRCTPTSSGSCGAACCLTTRT